MNRVVLELDNKLLDGELIQYKDGKLVSVEVHELLPELKQLVVLSDEISQLKQTISELAKIVKEK